MSSVAWTADQHREPSNAGPELTRRVPDPAIHEVMGEPRMIENEDVNSVAMKPVL